MSRWSQTWATVRRYALKTKGVLLALVVVSTFGLGFWIGVPPKKAKVEALEEVWTCAMHPQIKLPEPGSCPICGMDLIKLEDDSNAELDQVTMSERGKALAHIQTREVIRATTGVELRLLGRIEYDETRVRTVTPWVAGRVDKLFVSSLGARVKRGQTVASLYSPEVYAAQLDLITARRQVKRLKDALPIAQRASQQAVEAAESRLSLLGLSAKAVKRKPSRSVGVSATYGGTVIEQLVNEGAYVKAGQPLFRIADLTRLWVQLDAYEADIPRVRVGQKVTLEVSSFPGEVFEGNVAFVDPIVDPHTRTAQIRVELPNEGRRLRRGVFANAIVHTDGGEAENPLLIPKSAPLFTGRRSVVYVEVPKQDKPTYEAREVRLGAISGGHYPVLSGLKAGERVVVNGAFTLDSDLQIRGGRSMMSRPDDGERSAAPTIEVDQAFKTGLHPVLESYLLVHKTLSKDDLKGAKSAFAALAKRVEGFAPRQPSVAAKAWSKLSVKLRSSAKDGATAKDLDAARRAFEHAGAAVADALVKFGNPTEQTLHVATCPMAIDERSATWIQVAETVENPYRGSSMYRCGKIGPSVPTGDHLQAPAARADGDPPGPKPAPSHEHQHGGAQ